MSITELEEYFNSIELPETIQFKPAIIITDVKRFVEINLARAKIHGENPVYGNYYNDLLHLKGLLSQNKL